MKKIDSHIFSGMQQDSSISKQAAEFLRNALNIRITAREDRTSFSITNERGPSEVSLVFERFVDNAWETQVDVEKLLGRYLGHCILNNYLVIFTYIDNITSAIYRINLASTDVTNSYVATELYRGNLNFHPDYPIEATSYYENNNVQKVYWTDNRNPPRIINIAPIEDSNNINGNNTKFDFSPELDLKENIEITKLYGGGSFASGVIQYAITYYNKYAQETNIAIVSPLYYISPLDRGGRPDEICSNSFKIKITGVDSNFDYLRIYSIQRTSLNGTPICRRVQDIEINGKNSGEGKYIEYIDTGIYGDNIDPTELLYKGSDVILAETLCQKDNTLFFGNITLSKPAINESIRENIKDYMLTHTGIYISDRTLDANIISNGAFAYSNTLKENCAGFKSNEYYRIGIQFQYKTGSWSEPIWLRDTRIGLASGYEYFMPTIDSDGVPDVKIFNIKWRSQPNPGSESSEAQRKILRAVKDLKAAGYKKVRPLIAEPDLSNRTILFQGVFNPIMYRKKDRHVNTTDQTFTGHLYAQASWLFRPVVNETSEGIIDSIWKAEDYCGFISYNGKLKSIYADDLTHTGPIIGNSTDSHYTSTTGTNIYKDSSNDVVHYGKFQYSTEIQGIFNDEDSFYIDSPTDNETTTLFTINSPDILWDNDVQGYNVGNEFKIRRVTNIICTNNYGDMDITTSSGTIGSQGAGFIHRSIKTDGNAAFISQPCYQDSLVDDISDGNHDVLYRTNENGKAYPVLWMVYMWHRNGSLNNDVERSGRSAFLNTKKISNYKIGNLAGSVAADNENGIQDIKIFNSEELQYIKVGGLTYMGNIDTLLAPSDLSPFYYGNSPTDENFNIADYSVKVEDRLVVSKADNKYTGVFQWFSNKNRRINYSSPVPVWTDKPLIPDEWIPNNAYEPDLWDSDWGYYSEFGDGVYGLGGTREGVRMKYKSTPHAVVFCKNKIDYNANSTLPLVEIYKEYDENTLYGGQTLDALKANKWIPAGKAVDLTIEDEGGENERVNIEIAWEYGDTFFNRWDCLKTYAFTPQDQNQVVDILSFPVESHVNLDGRYDRNRGMASNLNASPINYNLMNMVYSQLDNFFSYRILDDSYYKLNTFSNQITWSKEKLAGADVDTWAYINLASTTDVDGSNGQIRALKTWKDTIYCFQDTGICQIIFNPRVQIPTSDNIPIEIGNSRKVEGIRYVSDNLGCTNKSAITSSSSGIYFTDSISKDLYIISTEGLVGLSNKLNFGTWFNNVPQGKWTPNNYSSKLFYDNVEQDVYITTSNECLCFSEKLGQFVSFLSYEGSLAMINTESTLFNLRSDTNESEDYVSIWKMFAGDYNIFFDEYKPFSISFISNAEVTASKIFTNIETRADFYDNLEDEEGEPFVHNDNPINNRKINPKKFFNKLRVKTEYQDTGEVELNWKNFLTYHSYEDFISQNTAKKNRIWRVTIPRDKDHKLDRIRNTWAEVSMTYDNEDNAYMELHDLSVQYHTNK